MVLLLIAHGRPSRSAQRGVLRGAPYRSGPRGPGSEVPGTGGRGPECLGTKGPSLSTSHDRPGPSVFPVCYGRSPSSTRWPW
ncbi:hypothetical protein T261_5142 [Streptomyces lydicus]|nr:hypothetical protein T261_5142 [Streptomyces lydicus]